MSDLSVLEWYLDQGVTDILENAPINRLALPLQLNVNPVSEIQKSTKAATIHAMPEMPLGSAEAHKEALRLAQSAQTLDELEKAIREFDGLSIKKTATNLVFADGNPKASIMIVGDAPDADDDIAGKPYAGLSGELLDKMLAAIGLSRHAEEAAKSIYISNILNWRPPGNRSPSASELETSLAFLERHIALVQPALLVVLGGVAAKALLNSNDTISKSRGKWTDYTPLNDVGGKAIPCLPMFEPSFLIQKPTQKKLAWADLQDLAEKLVKISQL